MVSFGDLRRAKELGLNLTSLLVRTYIEEHGFSPVGIIADACGICVRSAERALAALKAKGLLNGQTTKKSHDHVKQSFGRSRTATPVSDVSDASDAPAVKTAPQDPLAERLLAEGVLPWCVEILLSRVDRAVIERQLAWHSHRLAHGFAFKGHPAKFLFRACLNDYAAPHDLGEAPRQSVQTPAAPLRGREPKPADVPAHAPVEAEAAVMTRDGALTVVRMGMRSKLPAMRAEAERLAATWGINAAEWAAG